MQPNRSPFHTAWFAFAVSICVFGLLLLTAPAFGLTWDEPAYMQAAQSYHEWFSRLPRESSLMLSQPLIDAYWTPNHEHPPMVKLWYALVATPLVDTYGLIASYRVAAMLLSTALVTMVGVSVFRTFGLWGALAAVTLMLTFPRLFFHLHVAALDVPGALAYIGGVLVFWHSRNRKSIWIDLLFGVVWGIGIATKINAAFVIPTIGLWWLIADRRPYLLRRMAIGMLVGTMVFVASWPWLWVDPVARIVDYVRWITVDHWQIPQWFLGTLYLPPPWYFAPLMLVMTTPVISVIATGALPFVALQEQKPYLTLIGVAAGMPLLALMLSTTVYDNERLFMASFPLIAILAGVSLTRIAQKFSRGVALDRRIWGGIIATVIAIPIWQTSMLWPHLLSFYSTSIGGLPGARALNMDHTYWSSTYRDVLVYLDDNAPPNATVWIEAWSFDVPHTYQRDGIIRDDLRFVSDDGGSVWGMPITRMPAYEADYVLVTYRFAGWTPATAALVRGSTPPVFLIERAGVPLAALYRNP